jgi:hypothetical protein
MPGHVNRAEAAELHEIDRLLFCCCQSTANKLSVVCRLTCNYRHWQAYVAPTPAAAGDML